MVTCTRLEYFVVLLFFLLFLLYSTITYVTFLYRRESISPNKEQLLYNAFHYIVWEISRLSCSLRTVDDLNQTIDRFFLTDDIIIIPLRFKKKALDYTFLAILTGYL